MNFRVTHNTPFRILQTSIARTQRDLATAQERVATQKKLLSASDDPAGAGRALLQRSEIRQLRSFKDGIGFGVAVLGAQDSALDLTTKQLTRAKEIAVQLANGTNDPEARKAAAKEIEGIERSVTNLANTSVTGRHVFGGLASGAKPFLDLDDAGFNSSAPYVGPSDPFAIRIAKTQEVTLTTPGDQVFGSTIKALDDLRLSLAAGSDPTPSIDALGAATDRIIQERATVGARFAQLNGRRDEIATLDQTARVGLSSIEDADLAASISELVQLQSVLQATLASSNTLRTSILDYVSF